MTLQPVKTGDKGQRYEVRAKLKTGQETPVAWMEQRNTAENFVEVYTKLKEADPASPLDSLWVVDRQPDAGPDKMPREFFAHILQGRLQDELQGKPVTTELLERANKICADFAKEVDGFPVLEVVLVGTDRMEVFEPFETPDQVQRAMEAVLRSYGDESEADKAVVRASFDAILQRVNARRH